MNAAMEIITAMNLIMWVVIECYLCLFTSITIFMMNRQNKIEKTTVLRLSFISGSCGGIRTHT